MRYTPHLPLDTPEYDLEKIIKKGKDSPEGFSSIVLGTTGNFLDSTLKTLVAISSSPLLPFS
jgi:hypothetical protein